MPSQQNIDKLSQIKDKLSTAKSVILANYSGLNVNLQTELRAKVLDIGGEFTVSKNNLIALALKENLSSELPEEARKALEGPTAILYSNKDAVAALKALVEFAEEHGDLPEIKLGFMDGKILSLEEVVALSKLPGRDELLAKLVGQLKGPLFGLVNVMSGNLRGLAQVLTAIKDSKSN